MAKDKPSGALLPYFDYVEDLENYAVAQLDIPNIPDGTPVSFVVLQLIRRGRVGFLDRPDPSRGFYGSRALNTRGRYGVPDAFVFDDGSKGEGGRKHFEVTRAAGARDIKANANAVPLSNLFRRYAAQLDICDRSITANIRAQIYGRIIAATGKEEKQKLDAILASLETGKPCVLDRTELELLENVDITVPVTFTDTLAARSAIWADAMRRCGSIAANVYRNEPSHTETGAEARIAETIDAVYIMIDTFNADCERQKILGTDGKPLRMAYKGYAARFDGGEESAIEVEGGGQE